MVDQEARMEILAYRKQCLGYDGRGMQSTGMFSNTRRTFLRSTGTLAAGLGGSAFAHSPSDQQPSPLPPEGEAVKMPKVKFGDVQMSRLMVGVNPFWGGTHYIPIYEAMMREWYTPARVVEVLQRCQSYGINAYNYFHSPGKESRTQADWERYLASGGNMHLVAIATNNPEDLVKAVKPMAVWVIGEITDNAFHAGKMGTVRDYCKKLRDLGVKMVGVGSHIPEVLTMVEEQGWDVDFYAGCAYNRRRTIEQLRGLFSGELPEMPQEVYLQDDPPRMYKVFRQTKKPCIAFKILAAGRVRSPEAAFKLAFESIKPTDLICVGMCPRIKDEVKENAEFTNRFGSVAL